LILALENTMARGLRAMVLRASLTAPPNNGQWRADFFAHASVIL
jgi:hypothetical protein